MNTLPFWKNWQKPTRILYFLALTILLISIIAFSFYYIRGIENVVRWDIISELNEVPIVLDSFKIAKETLTLPTKAYTVTEQFVASPMAINTMSGYLFLGLFIAGFLFIIAALSTLTRFAYLTSMGVVIVLLVTFNVGLVFNLINNYVNIGLIVSYIGLSYFFHAFRPDLTIVKRFVCFLLLTIVISFIILSYSKVQHPFLLLASYRTSGALLLSIGFIFMISYEIINGFLYITTSAKSPQSLLNFLIISGIYLSNVLLIFLYNNKVIDWNMIYLSPFLLLLISTIVGIWGFMKRSILMENIMDFEHTGSFIYIGLGIITLATCGFAFATANDPMVEVLEDAVTYTHLAMGVMFVGYVMTNFLTLFKQALPIHKVVFKPLNLPLWLFRVLAVISIAALLVLKGFYPVQQSFTAYYNQLGDYYTLEEDYKFAEVEYKLALAYEYRNHKTNYALASLSLKQGDNESAAIYFRRALAKNPSTFAYEGLSRSFYDTDHFFESMFTLKEGLQKFPNSGELQNNLAYLYNKSNVLDSTVVMYELAVKNAKKSEVPAANLVAFWAKNGKKTTVQEILDKVENRPYNTYQANILALKNLQAKATTTNVKAWEGKLSADSILNVSDFAWIYNQTIFQKSVGNVLPLKRLSELEDNESLTEDLLFANVIQEYYKGEKLLTFQNLQAWAVGDSADKKGKYYQLLLNTLLKKELYDNAPPNLMAAVKVNQITPIVNQHPLNELVVEKAVAIYNKAKQPEKGYQIVLNALAWRKNSPKLYEIFISQALTIGMKDYAAEGLVTLQKLSPTDYQRFLPTYQARIQSIEKAGAGFQ